MANILLEVAENKRHICIQRGFIIINGGKEVLGKISIDSVTAVILSGDAITLSKQFLARMAEERIPVIVCDKKYMPISINLPYGTHYKSLPVLTAQMQASPVLKKQLWQKIITTKITNQAYTLAACRPEHPLIKRLKLLASKVRSGDTDNKEAQAARLYWPALLGKHFIRDQNGEGANIFLNYGYTIIRAACARALCGAGLLPLLGVQHHNVYNAFCLADDIMEPLRPFIDKHIFSYIDVQDCTQLEPTHKKYIAQILRSPLPLKGEGHLLSSIAVQMAYGLAKSFKNNDPTALLLPCAI